MALLNSMNKEQLAKVALEVLPERKSVIYDSGIYPIEIVYVEIQTKESGAQQLVVRYKHENSEGTLFGPFITNKEGKRNEIGFNKLLELQAVTGVKELNTVEKEVVVNNSGLTKVATIIKELSGKKVFVQTMLEYGKYNGNIVRRLNILGFFRATDLASISEISLGSGNGDRYRWLTDGENPRCNQIRYRDGVTEAEAIEYEESRRAQYEASKATKSADEQRLDGGSDSDEEMPF
jgi:hypothetical protein